MLNQSSHRMRGSPTAMNRRRETVKVELWAGVT